MKRVFFLCLLATLSVFLFSETLQFEQPTIEYRDGYAYVRLAGGASWGEPGQPSVPAVGFRHLAAWGEDVTNIEVTHGQPLRIDLEAPLAPAQQMYPLSSLAETQPDFTQPDAAAYASQQWPLNDFAALKTSIYRGYHIASAVVFPVVYLPSEQALLFYPELTVNVETAPSTKATSDALLRDDPQTMRVLSDMLGSVANAATYPIPATRDRDMIDYVIITPTDFIEEFQPLADYKNSLGLVTSVVSVESILSTYTGEDDQDKIRNFIIDMYTNNGMSYVLLGGDDENIPHRGFLVDLGYGYTDHDVASDLYYFGLDGTWNDDNDNDWGEWSEADFFADVYGGRAPVDSEAEAITFVTKQIMYQQTPVEEDLTNDMLIGEDLGWTPWGMDYMEEIRLGGTYNGYTTVGIPDHITVDTLYDLQGIWTTTQLFDNLNEGRNMVSHLGHCNVHYNMKFYTDDVDTQHITNDGVNDNFYIVYTQGCYCNSFDNRDTNGNYSNEDAISEQWLLLPTGAVCYIGNTRYGWGDGDGTNGPSQRLHREFYDAMYGEGYTLISEAHEDSRFDTEPFLSPNTTLLWSFYECTVMGDPTLDIWSNQPEAITLDTPSILPIGSTGVDITVSGANLDFETIRAAAIMDDELRAVGYLDASGSVTLTFDTALDTPGEMEVVVSGHNVLDTSETIIVIAPDEAYLTPHTYTITDNGDDMIAWNEMAILDVVTENVGNQTATNVVATITTECEYINLLTATLEFGDIAAHATASCDSGFVFHTMQDVPLDDTASFTITFTAGDDTWDYNFSCPVYGMSVPMVGDNWAEISGHFNGFPDPGDVLTPLMTLVNESGVTIDELSLTVECDNPDVTIDPLTLDWEDVAAGDILSMDDFTVTISEDVDPMTMLHFYMTLDADRGHQAHSIACVEIEVLADDFEAQQTVNYWTLDDDLSGENDWHHSNQNNHTSFGDSAWKFGSTGGGDYSNNSYGALESEPFTVPDNAELTFWQWIDAENSSNYPGEAYDGGLLEISDDNGASWTQITPVGGYPYTSRGSSSPVPEGTPMWSGIVDWDQIWVDLDDYAGDEVMIRFVFFSDGAETEVGWFIDDVRVQTDPPLMPPVNLTGEFSSGFANIMWQGPNCAVDSYIVKRDGEVLAEGVTTFSFADDISEFPPGDYSYTVASVFEGEVSDDSDPLIISSVEAGEDTPGLTTALRGNYPNPFNPETMVSFSVASPQHVSLKVYNVRGQLVRTLADDHFEAGEHNIVWRGDDSHGHSTASGLYFVRMSAADKTFTRKMLLLK